MATLAVTNTFVAGNTIVAADMNENFDDIEAFVNTTPGVVQEDIIDAVGDIIHGDAADSVAKLAVGTNDHCLVADSAISSVGLKWAVPTDTTKMPLAGGTFTGAVAAGSDGSGVDVTFYSATAGDTMLWDASEEKLVLEGTNGATVLDITDGNVVIGDGTLTVGSDGAGEDVTFHSDTAGDAFVWDSSEEKLTITGTNAQTALAVADGNATFADDVTVTGNLTTGNLTVTGTTTNHLTVPGDNGDAAIAPALGDENNYIRTTHATALVTLPQDSVEAFAVGTTIYYERYGTGTLTFAAGTGVTELSSKDSTKTCADRYTTVAALKTGTNTWALIGNIG
jgi:hypothetical protein